MSKLENKLIPLFFYTLFFFTPIILFPKSSEVFEFNKMVLVYATTILIVGTWVIKCIISKKFIFRRTILDIPLILFLLGQLVATAFSIDQTTSIFGYYGRFHGGLLSSISYALLFWAYVSNVSKENTIKAIKLLLASGVLVATYGVLQHFGVDEKYWTQDVRARVFSTLGQPNWLAAWIVSLIPLAWVLGLSSKKQIVKNKKAILSLVVSSLFFLTLLFTKSRSGILGFASLYIVFWGIMLFLSKYFSKAKKVFTRNFFIFLNLLFVVSVLFFGTASSEGISSWLDTSSQTISQTQNSTLEGTGSGNLRKYVWKAGVDIYKANPVVGTGVETFAYSYSGYKPVEQNETSEWNFIYNKAHNEYINFFANSGTLGGLTYLLLVVFSLAILVKPIFQKRKKNLLNIALLSGYVSILVTNFFGFSVVPIAVNFFLFPAFAVALEVKNKERNVKKKLNTIQALLTIVVVLISIYLLFITSRHWYADYLYSKGRSLNTSEQYKEASKSLETAIKLQKYPVYLNELSKSYNELALLGFEENIQGYERLVSKSLETSQNAINSSPRNVSFLKNRSNIYTNLSGIDSDYLNNAIETMLITLAISPNDPAIYYRIGLTFNRIGDIESSIEFLKQAINLKSNYKEPTIALALIYRDIGETEKAEDLLGDFLQNVNPDDEDIKSLLN